MNVFMTRRRDERGQVLATVGSGMVALILIAALVVDLGVSWMLSRHAQNAADSAALAAARWIPQYDVNGVFDSTYGPQGPNPGPAGYMWQEACAAARANGFWPDAASLPNPNLGCLPAYDGDRAATLTVYYPPAVGSLQDFWKTRGFVQVIIEARHESFFGRLIGQAWATVSSSAVVANQDDTASHYSLVALDPSSTCSTASISGNGVGFVPPAQNVPSIVVAQTRPGSNSWNSGTNMLAEIVAPTSSPPVMLAAQSVTAFTSAVTVTNATTIGYTLSFKNAVVGLSAADFTITGTSTPWSIISITGSSTGPYAITLTGAASTDGTVTLTVKNDAVTGLGSAVTATNAPVTVDRTKPTVSSLTAPSTSTGTPVAYTLTFSEPLQGGTLTTSDFTVTSTAGTWTITSLSGSGPYSITLTGSAVTNGTVQLKLNANSVADPAGNIGPTSGANGTIVTVTIPVFPQVVSFAPTSTSSNGGPITYNLTFNESVSDLASNDFATTTSGTASGTSWNVTVVSGSGAGPYTITITPSKAQPDGATITLTLNANRVVNGTGNLGPTAAFSAATVTFHPVTPAVASFAPTSTTSDGTPITYNLVFNETIDSSTLAAGDFTVGGTSPGWAVSGIGGGGATYTVTLSSGAPANGSVTLMLKANTVTDFGFSGGPTSAYPASPSPVTVTLTAPELVTAASVPLTAYNVGTGHYELSAASVTYSLTFTTAITAGSLVDTDFTVSPTNTSTGWSVAAISGSGTNWSVTLTTTDVIVGGTSLDLTLNQSSVASVGPPSYNGPSQAYAFPAVWIVAVPAKVTVGGAVFINSTCASGPPDSQCSGGAGALSISGGGTLGADQGVWIAGSCSAGSNKVTCLNSANCPHEGATQIGDPIGQLGAPPKPSNGTCDGATASAAKCNFKKGTHTMTPGYFPGGISAKNGAIVCADPGLYYIGGGGVTLSPGSTLIAQVYNSATGTGIASCPNAGGAVFFSGDVPGPTHDACVTSLGLDGTVCQRGFSFKGAMKADSMATGPYQGMLMWLDNLGSCPTLSANCNSTLTAQGSTASGTIYLPRWSVKIAGAATTGSCDFTIQVIAYQWSVTGNSSITICWNKDTLWHIAQRGLVH